MVTLAEQVAYQAAMADLTTSAIADLVEGVGDFTAMTADAAAALMREVWPVVAAEWGEQAAAVSADLYDEARYAALGAAAGGYVATMAPTPGDDLVDDALGWALAPLFNTETPDPVSSLARGAGKLQRAVAGQGRDTIRISAEQDPVGTRYIRHASPTACTFCRMLALNNRYLTEESAVRVVGEVDPRDLARTSRGPRGVREAGEKYHDNCKCIAVPVFPGETAERAPYVSDWQDQYDKVARLTGTRRADVKALMKTWRELYDAR